MDQKHILPVSSEPFTATAISWNKRVFACIRSSRGEISSQKHSDGLDKISAVVYECDPTLNNGLFLQGYADDDDESTAY